MSFACSARETGAGGRRVGALGHCRALSVHCPSGWLAAGFRSGASDGRGWGGGNLHLAGRGLFRCRENHPHLGRCIKRFLPPRLRRWRCGWKFTQYSPTREWVEGGGDRTFGAEPPGFGSPNTGYRAPAPGSPCLVSAAQRWAEGGGWAIHYGRCPHPLQALIPTNTDLTNHQPTRELRDPVTARGRSSPTGGCAPGWPGRSRGR